MKTKLSTINSQLINNNRGSALVLTVIVMINALLIVATIASISIVERKASNKTKNSTPAFQAADSAVEWTLKKLKDSATVSDVGDLCDLGVVDGTSGKCVPKDLIMPANTDVELYFIDGGGSVITDATDSIYDIVLLRAIGRFGVGEDRVSRALEVSVSQISPIAWWPFADGKNTDGESAQGDTVLDISGNANDATANDGTWQTAVAGSECYTDSEICMEFDGEPEDGQFVAPFAASDNFVQAGHKDVYKTDQGSIIFWFKVEDLNPNDQTIFSKEAQGIAENHISIFVSNDAGVVASSGDSTPTAGDHYLAVRLQDSSTSDSHFVFSDNPIVEDEWYFGVVTFGAEGMKLYLAKDGDANIQLQSVEGVNAFAGGISNNNEPIQFAVSSFSRPSGNVGPLDAPFDGFLDDIRIYNKQLKQGQIDKLYSNGPY